MASRFPEAFPEAKIAEMNVEELTSTQKKSTKFGLGVFRVSISWFFRSCYNINVKLHITDEGLRVVCLQLSAPVAIND